MWLLPRLALTLACALIVLLTSAASTCLAGEKAVMVAVDHATQPFTLPDSDSGLQVEIIRAAFASQSTPVTFVFLSSKRTALAFKSGLVDVLTDDKPGNNVTNVNSHWPVMTFRNQAITSTHKNLKLNSIADLSKLRVVAFQEASRYLGAEFAAMANHNSAYLELPHMPSRMLSLDRTDVIISQPDIFRFNLTNESSPTQINQVFESFEYHDILPAVNQYWFGFRDEALRDRFERGIAAIYANGEIDALFRQYQQSYGTSRGMFISLDCQFLKSNRQEACDTYAQTKKQ